MRVPHKITTLLLFLAFLPAAKSQLSAYFSPGLFYTHANGPYVETNLTVLGKTLRGKLSEGKLRNSVNITARILRDTTIVKAARYNLHGPFYSDSLKAPAFIDCQRYFLPNGKYDIELTLADNNNKDKKPLTIRSEVVVDFRNNRIESSFIQPLENYNKAPVAGPLTKSGYDLIPYNSGYYPESSRQLAFYYEVYNAAAVLGAQKPMVLSWHIETAADSSRLSSYGGFQKELASPVNVLLARADISTLGTGEYALVVELNDAQNVLLKKDKLYFRRMNRRVDIATLQNLDEKELIASFVGSTNNADTLQMYVECLWPIADGVDKELVIDESVKKDPGSMKRFVVDFWRRRAADTANPLQMWATYYREVQKVMVLFKCGKQKGYYSDRGRVFLQYGPPSQRSQQTNEANTFPYEIWQYYRITDATNGNFFSNRKFVFVNKQLGDDCYNLVHSDMRGETNNPRWQFEVTRRNYEGIQNPDNETPGGTNDSQFREIYQNPR